MSQLSEVKFTVDEASINSEFGYCWLTRHEVRQLYILNLNGYFEFENDKIFGKVCIQSTVNFESIDICEDIPVNKQINLGKIELRPKNPNAFIEVSDSYLQHIWSLYNLCNHKVIITFTTEKTVLQVREVASIFVEIEKREENKKRGFFW